LTESPADFEVTRERQDGAFVVRVKGEIDLSTHEHLGEELIRAAGEGGPVIVDLSGCSFIDSSGIRALLLGSRAASENGDGPFAIAGATPAVERVLKLTRVDEAITIYENVDEALASF